MLQKVLTVWAHFLNSEDSLYVLNTTSSGWLSSEALAKIHIEEFIHDADKAFYGFKSWNDRARPLTATASCCALLSWAWRASPKNKRKRRGFLRLIVVFRATLDSRRGGGFAGPPQLINATKRATDT